jgi:hypothetical protein
MLLLMDLFAPFAGVQSNKSPKIQQISTGTSWYTFFVSGSH